MDDQLTINDLPVECVEEILKWITDRVDRIYVRFVCKMWCALIDRDCSAECYEIEVLQVDYNQLVEHAINDNGVRVLNFNEMFSSLFLDSQRKKTSFDFVNVNFQGSEQFWRTKGAVIISLYFRIDWFNIPLKEIVEHCSMLNSLTIELNDDKEQELCNMLENCVTHGKKNFSVRSLYFKHQTLSNVTSVTNIAMIVGRVFLGVQNVFFEDVIFDDVISLDWTDKMNSLSTAFENLSFVITFSDINKMRTISFDPSGYVPVKMTTLTINYDDVLNDDISAHLSHYPGGHNYLNRLILLWNRPPPYRLDDFQVLISLCPSLKSISVRDVVKFFPLTKPLNKNNIEDLSLEWDINEDYVLTINDAFLQSFKNLKSFECQELVFSNFVKLLRQLPNLEKLVVFKGSVDVNQDEEQTILNVKLLKLEMPRSFLLLTTAKYDFNNLKELGFWEWVNECRCLCENILDLSARVMDKQLKRMNCPKLERIFFEFDEKQSSSDQCEFTNWMVNILSLFPTLTEFSISWEDDIIIKKESRDMAKADQILTTILGKLKYRRLRKIGSEDHPHKLNVISPSIIKHRCSYGESVLHIP